MKFSLVSVRNKAHYYQTSLLSSILYCFLLNTFLNTKEKTSSSPTVTKISDLNLIC